MANLARGPVRGVLSRFCRLGSELVRSQEKTLAGAGYKTTTGIVGVDVDPNAPDTLKSKLKQILRVRKRKKKKKEENRNKKRKHTHNAITFLCSFFLFSSLPSSLSPSLFLFLSLSLCAN